MDFKIKYNEAGIRKVQNAMKDALADAANDVLDEVRDNIPVETGHLRDRTVIDTTSLNTGAVKIISSTEYAQAVYYNPEVAGNHWFSGLEDVAKSSFSKNMKRRLKK